ncbi:hypothetical protein MMC13_006528 [Lambiella insularis]|nr:hypothetical protein [Lambiella insularis]
MAKRTANEPHGHAPAKKRRCNSQSEKKKGKSRVSTTTRSRKHGEFVSRLDPLTIDPSTVGRTSILCLPKAGRHERSTKFPFFALPREIRDCIISLCMLPPGTRITGGTEPPAPHHGWLEDLVQPMVLYCPFRPSLSLLKVSKQMHEEASYNLYGRSRFEFLISTTHIANILNQDKIENNTLGVAPHYLARIRNMTLFIAINSYCCNLPHFQYLRVKNALQRFADTLNGESGHNIERLHIKYTEFESKHGRADHRRYHHQHDNSWSRSTVMDHLRTEYLRVYRNVPLGIPGTERSEDLFSTKYQNVLEPLGTIFNITEVRVVGVEAGFAARLTAAMQSPQKMCRPMERQLDQTRRRKGPWWSSTFEWDFSTS